MNSHCEASSSKHHIHFHHRRHHSDEQDLSRLLDPAYTRTRPSSPQTRVYKDNHGQFHDPDYRHFPSSSPKSRSRRVGSGVSRPSWELGLGTGMDEEEFEALYNDEELERTTTRSTVRPRRTLYSSSPSSSYTTYSPPLAPSSLPSSSPSSMASSLSDTELPSYEFPDSSYTTTTPSLCQHKLTKRLLSRHPRSSFEEHVHPTEFDDGVSYESEETDPVEDVDVRSQSSDGGVSSVKKQWQSMQLSVRFGVFRAQRRMKEVLGAKR